jgi:hypothetical protein
MAGCRGDGEFALDVVAEVWRVLGYCDGKGEARRETGTYWRKMIRAWGRAISFQRPKGRNGFLN